MMNFSNMLPLLLFLGNVLSEEDVCVTTNEVKKCDKHAERTFIAIKPDAVQRGLVGDIINRFERKGFKLVAIKLLHASQDLLELHYEEHKERPFFPALVEYMGSGPVAAMVWEGKGVVKGGRSLLGATNPTEAAPGTIRGDLAMETGRNLCHASDSDVAARREIKLWFNDEWVRWEADLAKWIHE
eukprot:GFUD01000820.1.p1 GENE.GFUD01000820.1~~GFUD01000820.1.p1  ORF type:complete len:185 (-),score=57.88 GFUD01000820.1:81-635(-)